MPTSYVRNDQGRDYERCPLASLPFYQRPAVLELAVIQRFYAEQRAPSQRDEEAYAMGTSHSLSFAALLKRHRRLAHLTQEQLAAQAGYSVSYISMLERGERVPVRATV